MRIVSLQAVVSATCYTVAIPVSVFRRRMLGENGDRLHDLLQKYKPAGIDAIEYDGHFGSNLYFRAETDEDRLRFMHIVQSLLSMPMRAWKTWTPT